MKQSLKKKLATVLMVALLGTTAVPAMALEGATNTTAGQTNSLEAAEAGYRDMIERYSIAQENNFFEGDWGMLEEFDLNSETYLLRGDATLHYCLVDTAQDGVPELFIANYDGSDFTVNEFGNRIGGYNIYDTCGFANGVTERLFDTYSMGYRIKYSIMNNGVISFAGSSSARSGSNNYYTLGANSKSPYLSCFISYDLWNGDYYWQGYGNYNNKWRISKAQRDNVVHSYTYARNLKWYPVSDTASLHQAMRSFSIPVRINGSELDCDQPAVARNGRTLVPLHAIFEALGAEVEWNGVTQTITAVKDNTTVQMRLNSKTMTKNGQTIALDVSPQAIGGRTMVPVRAIANAFDYNVYWDSANRVVEINS